MGCDLFLFGFRFITCRYEYKQQQKQGQGQTLFQPAGTELGFLKHIQSF